MAQLDLSHIPLFYRVFLLWFEPFAAWNGSQMALRTPNEYLKVMTPHWTDIAQTPQFQVIVDQVGACYLMFGLIEAFVLRSTSEMRVWRAVVWSFLICDVVHVYASYSALGWETLTNPTPWRWQDWVNMVILWISLGTRVAFLLGLGIREPAKGRKTA